MEEAAAQVQEPAELLPLEHNDLLEVLGLEDCELVGLNALVDQVDALIDNLSVSVSILDDVLTQSRKHIYCVADLVEFRAVDVVFQLVVYLEVVLEEYL